MLCPSQEVKVLNGMDGSRFGETSWRQNVRRAAKAWSAFSGETRPGMIARTSGVATTGRISPIQGRGASQMTPRIGSGSIWAQMSAATAAIIECHML
jgi:hypothetical protein